MICCFPYGAVLVTVLYVVICVLILSQLRGCTSENGIDCDADDKDDLISMWKIYLLNANIIACLSLHLLVYRRCYCSGKSGFEIALSGALALACISVAFITKCIVAFRDTRFEDEKETNGNYAWTAVFYVLMGLSSTLFGILFHLSSKRAKETTLAMIFIVLNIVATIFLVSICAVLTASQSNMILNQPDIDEQLESPPEDFFLLQLLRIGQGLWNTSYSLFLLSISFVWGSTAKKNVMFVMGLPNSLAAAGIIIAQLMSGILRLLLIIKIGIDEETFKQDVKNNFATLFIEYATLMTIFFVHNLITSFLSEKNNKYGDGGKIESDPGYPTDKSDTPDTDSSLDGSKGFTIVSNSVMNEVSNKTNLSNKQFGDGVAINRNKTSRLPVDGNRIDFALNSTIAYNDIETGNHSFKNLENDDCVSRHTPTEVASAEVPNDCVSSKHEIGAMCGYITSFLSDTQKPVLFYDTQTRKTIHDGALPHNKSDDIVSKMACKITNSALAAYCAVPSCNSNDRGCHPENANNFNESQGKQFIRPSSSMEQCVTSEVTLYSQQDGLMNEIHGKIKGAPLLIEVAPEKYTKIANSKLRHESSSSHSNDANSAFEQKCWYAITNANKKSDTKELKNIEGTEVPLENDAIENDKTSSSVESKLLLQDKRKKKRFNQSDSRIESKEDINTKLNSRNKKENPMKRGVIQSMTSESEVSHSAISKPLKSFNTSCDNGISIEPEIEEGGRLPMNASIVSVYWKRERSENVHRRKSKEPSNSSYKNLLCEKVTEERLDTFLHPKFWQNFSSENQNSEAISISERTMNIKMNIKSNHLFKSGSEINDGVKTSPGRKSQITEERNFIGDNGACEDRISSHPGNVVLNCFDGSLKQLTKVLDVGVNQFQCFSSFPDQQNDELQFQQYAHRNFSSKANKDILDVPVLLQIPTFHSDCVSTFTSDFEDSNSEQHAFTSIEKADDQPHQFEEMSKGNDSGNNGDEKKLTSGIDDDTGNKLSNDDVKALQIVQDYTKLPSIIEKRKSLIT